MLVRGLAGGDAGPQDGRDHGVVAEQDTRGALGLEPSNIGQLAAGQHGVKLVPVRPVEADDPEFVFLIFLPAPGQVQDPQKCKNKSQAKAR
jgi:hypothetical protein